MVIIPRVLTGLIRDVDDHAAQRLVLAFAERAIQICVDALGEEEREISLAYIGAARDLAEGNGTISNLGNAHHVYFSARHQGTRLSDDVTWVTAMAVAACCQRQMEDAGLIVRVRYMPSLLSVAKAAQTAAGRCAAASEDEWRDGDSSAVARRARWLEAKWQLVHLIESLRFPGEDAPAD